MHEPTLTKLPALLCFCTAQELVGEGSFGRVYRAVWRGMAVAVKELKVSHDIAEDTLLRELHHEALMMSRVCNHDNVIKFVGVTKSAVVTSFMAYGSVEDLVIRPGPRNLRSGMSPLAILSLCVQAASGILHLHKEGTPRDSRAGPLSGVTP